MANNAFVSAVWNAARSYGLSAPRITDAILRDLFPQTAKAALEEGADLMLRRGVIIAVKVVLRTSAGHPEQVDMASVHASFAPIVERLNRRSFHVPSLEVEVQVSELILNPDWLNEARVFMRQKGEETIAQADVLDELYRAVIGNSSPSIVPEGSSGSPVVAA